MREKKSDSHLKKKEFDIVQGYSLNSLKNWIIWKYVPYSLYYTCEF